MGVVVVGVIIYFGLEELRCQIEEIFVVFERVYELGMVIVLWVYLCNFVFKKDGVDYYVFVDLIGQVNYLVVIIGVDIVK